MSVIVHTTGSARELRPSESFTTLKTLGGGDRRNRMLYIAAEATVSLSVRVCSYRPLPTSCARPTDVIG